MRRSPPHVDSERLVEGLCTGCQNLPYPHHGEPGLQQVLRGIAGTTVDFYETRLFQGHSRADQGRPDFLFKEKTRADQTLPGLASKPIDEANQAFARPHWG